MLLRKHPVVPLTNAQSLPPPACPVVIMCSTPMHPPWHCYLVSEQCLLLPQQPTERHAVIQPPFQIEPKCELVVVQARASCKHTVI